jgi:hypothetical protein
LFGKVGLFTKHHIYQALQQEHRPTSNVKIAKPHNGMRILRGGIKIELSRIIATK